MSSANAENRNYFLFRSCREIPLESGLVGMGWDDIKFNEFETAEDIIKDITQVRGWNIGRRSEQIRKFKRIRKDDLIVVPYWGTAVIGVALGEEVYDPRFYNKSGCNQQRVRFPKDSFGKVIQLPRANFTTEFQARLKIRITIAELGYFKSELDRALKDLDAGKLYSADIDFVQKTEKQKQEFKDQLLQNIQQNKTGLAAGGTGLEQLVKELLIINGFEAEVLSKRAHPGRADADIRATKINALRNDEYFVQVKHHKGITGTWGLQQLLEIPKLEPEYENHQLVLVTSGELRQEDLEGAEKNDVIVLDGRELVDWIWDSIPKLSSKSKIALRISDVPQIGI
jgi:restriction system protein